MNLHNAPDQINSWPQVKKLISDLECQPVELITLYGADLSNLHLLRSFPSMEKVWSHELLIACVKQLPTFQLETIVTI